MLKRTSQRPSGVTLQLPLIVLVLGFTAIPIQLRPLTREMLAARMEVALDVPDIVANIVGYVPFGIVFASRGPWATLGLAASVSLLAETSQLFSESRSPGLIDVATNVLGAILGLVITSRWITIWRIRPPTFEPGRAKAIIAGTLALGYAALGARVSPLRVEETVTKYLETPRLAWLEVNQRGANAPGRLEGQWTFESAGATSVVDVSGNGLNGTLVNKPTVTDGIDGRSLTLNGTNQYVDLGDPLALRLTGSETISAWINASSFPVDDAAVVSDHSGLGYQLDTTVDRGPRTIGFKLANAFGQLMARYGRTPLALNTWYHIAGVYDAQAQTLNVYLNGKQDNGYLRGTVTNRQHVSGMKAYIGRRASEPGFEFAGAIDDVRIYSRALTQSEIEADFDAAPGAPSIPAFSEAASDRATCASHEVADSRSSGLIVVLGVLVAIAVLGFWPTVSRRTLCLACFATGLLLIPTIDPLMPAGYRWFFPLFTLAGGASIAFSIVPRETPS